MKDSKIYAQKVRRLLRGLRATSSKDELADHKDLLQALMHGVICEYFPDNQAHQMYRKMMHHFVDINDLRVARPEEIMDVWSEHSAQARAAASKVTTLLMTVFNKFHTLDLSGLKKTGKRPAKNFLQALDGVSRFALDYSMLTCMEAHTIPINDQMMEYLKAEQLVHPDADLSQVASFLAKLVPAKRAYEAYRLIRSHAHNWAMRAASKAAQKASQRDSAEL